MYRQLLAYFLIAAVGIFGFLRIEHLKDAQVEQARFAKCEAINRSREVLLDLIRAQKTIQAPPDASPDLRSVTEEINRRAVMLEARAQVLLTPADCVAVG